MSQRPILVSQLAHDLLGSEILTVAGEIARMRADGHPVGNFTVGDFDPHHFPLPPQLLQLILQAYKDGHTNYPPAMGTVELRNAVIKWYLQELALEYTPAEVLIGAGGRPLIYATYLAIIDPGDTVLYGVPSWNNNHYAQLVGGVPVEVRTSHLNNFQVTAADLAPHLAQAALLVLCSPQNPSGTMFGRDQLEEICKLVVHENRMRKPRGQKPLYILYDQMYWQLTFGLEHYHPASLYPELRDYVVTVDGASKSFCATGIRVGWALGPESLITRMSTIMAHMGGWAPKPEQLATAQFLSTPGAAKAFTMQLSERLAQRLRLLYDELNSLRIQGLPIECVEPQGGLYLSAQFRVMGYNTEGGRKLTTSEDIRSYLLEDALFAAVPFTAFGLKEQNGWFRIAVGTVDEEEISEATTRLEISLRRLQAL